MPQLLFQDSHDIFIIKDMRQTNILRLVLDTGTIDNCVLELLDQTLVDLVTEVFNCTCRASKNNGLIVIRCFTLGLGVHTDQVQTLPHDLEQLVQVPAVLRRNGHGVGNLRQNI